LVDLVNQHPLLFVDGRPFLHHLEHFDNTWGFFFLPSSFFSLLNNFDQKRKEIQTVPYILQRAVNIGIPDV
jgi:hypothetical protein